MSEKKKIVIAIGGSSGSIYAYRLIKLLSGTDHHLDIVMTNNAIVNWELELGTFDKTTIPYKIWDNKDFFAPFASGSALYDAMCICPCSMGLLGRVAHGISDDLITRAADVMLKERRQLLLVPRETPYNLIHLQNMTVLTQAGATICPATPSFYHNPQSKEDIADTVIYRVLDLMGIHLQRNRWGA